MKTLSQLAEEQIQLNAAPAHIAGTLYRRTEDMDNMTKGKFIMMDGKRLEISDWQEERFDVAVTASPADQKLHTLTPATTGFREALMRDAA